ncbi:regulatory protein, luxR family [Variovorax sp. YR634]|uniref:helix-turn-helix transcriptional regulator n=1 Tax=unclassified Variovorax TaxID=663243 RepID=UPI00089C66B4|nr:MULTISPECIES: helix-turn-helix transcriptional regulator [unclassified Variovorax]SDZ49436.1 regulatory protein, luxR family [Variovorax sp. YR634]SOD28558.1 regulatory protein, luxR family [Variovorax sp. YR752]
MPPRTSPFGSAAFSSSGGEPLSLLRLARTTGSERFQHELLRRLLDEFRADHGAINTWHPRSFVSSVGIGYDLAAMSEQWNRINGADLDFITFAMRAQPEQAAFANDDDPRWKQTPPAWREFLSRHGIVHQMGVAIPFEGSDTFVHLYLNRGPGSPAHTERDARVLTALTPQIRESLLVNRLYAHARQGLDEEAQPLALTDSQGWVLFANRAFCAAWPALADLAGATSPRLPEDWLSGRRGALRRLEAAGWSIDVARDESGLRVALRRRLAGGGACILTPRQAEIARLYCAGHSSKDVGLRLGLSPATVRVHLRNAYDRAGVGSRAALRAWLGI